uniref:Ig-like domain-containing protein n=1 Tax=Magallana gigas TaxID=29159 RepID=A0A8W8J6F4_MAGGI
MFISGEVSFSWKPLDYSLYDVLLTKDDSPDAWVRVSDSQYTVKHVLLYDSIRIIVRRSGSNVINIMTYNVSKVKTQIGGKTNISWTAAYFPFSGQYYVYHTYKENRTILSISSSGVNYGEDTQTSKYAYTSRPFNSTNIVFEIRDITLDDAGYYNGGMSADAAWSGGGVVLIVSGKPEKPKIDGKLNTLVNAFLELICVSKSTSTPDYYSKLLILSYTWFINNTKVEGKAKESFILNVTKWHRYNRYSCLATEEDLESDRSDAVQINPLYGPEKLTLTPKPKLDENDKFTVLEGDIVGPILCSADCNPPCNVTWKYKDSNGQRDALSQKGILLLRNVNRSNTQITCLSRWKNVSMKKDISLDVQYVDVPAVYLNDELVSSRINILEGKPFHLSCFVDGNPTPTVRLGKSQNGGTVILSEDRDHWSNYNIGTGAQCSDTGTYVCLGQSTDLKTNTRAIDVNILCAPRLDKEVRLETITESGKTRIVIIPVIAHPSLVVSKMVWFGPDNLPTNITTSAVLQFSGVIYQHRVISIISGLEDEKLGEYKLLYERKFLTSVFIRKEDIDDPIIYVNDEWVSDRITVDILEGKPFHMSCFVEGNPTRQFVLDSLQI